MANLLLRLLRADVQQHADAARKTAWHGYLARAQQWNIDPTHLPCRERRILRIEIVGDGKEGAADLFNWRLILLDEPPQQFLCRRADRLACIRRGGGRATDPSRSQAHFLPSLPSCCDGWLPQATKKQRSD